MGIVTKILATHAPCSTVLSDHLRQASDPSCGRAWRRIPELETVSDSVSDNALIIRLIRHIFNPYLTRNLTQAAIRKSLWALAFVGKSNEKGHLETASKWPLVEAAGMS
jgi:hypothetical protein